MKCENCKYFKQITVEEGWGKCTKHNSIVRAIWPKCKDFKDFREKEGSK